MYVKLDKIFEKILTTLQYGAGLLLMLYGIYIQNGLTITTSLVILTLLYLYRRQVKKTRGYEFIFKSLPDEKQINKMASDASNKFKNLTTFEKSIFETGFTEGVKKTIKEIEYKIDRIQ